MMFGDGVVCQGVLYEFFNMVMVWKLLVFYIVENNGYVMGIFVKWMSNVIEFYKMGLAYDMFSEVVDGMQLEVVYEVVSCVVEYICVGNGFYFFEVQIYCYKGYFVFDLAKYWIKEEVQEYKDCDLIKIIERMILDNKIVIEDEFKEIENKIKEEIKVVVKFVEELDYFDFLEFYMDNYLQEDYFFIRDQNFKGYFV